MDPRRQVGNFRRLAIKSENRPEFWSLLKIRLLPRIIKAGCMALPYPGDSPEVTMDNVGAPMDMTEVKIVDRKTGDLVKLGEQGELSKFKNWKRFNLEILQVNCLWEATMLCLDIGKMKKKPKRPLIHLIGVYQGM